jgi:hypothetical protein
MKLGFISRKQLLLLLLSGLFYIIFFYNLIGSSLKGIFTEATILSLFVLVSFYIVSVTCTAFLLSLTGGIHAISKKMTKEPYSLHSLSALTLVPLCLYIPLARHLLWIKYELYAVSGSIIFISLNWRGWRKSGVDFLVCFGLLILGLASFPLLLAALSAGVFYLKGMLF